MRTIDKILTKLDCHTDAPMGRRGEADGIFSSFPFLSPLDAKKLPKIFDCKVELTDGYDKGGAYWGMPNNLRVQYTKDLKYINFYRK
jgi:hypothetical protein